VYHTARVVAGIICPFDEFAFFHFMLTPVTLWIFPANFPFVSFTYEVIDVSNIGTTVGEFEVVPKKCCYSSSDTGPDTCKVCECHGVCEDVCVCVRGCV